jgi:hypothetical protein
VGTAGAEQRHQYDLAIGIPATPPLAGLRAWLRGLLGDESEEFVLDVELVATELVTNAYEHTERPLAIRVHRPADRSVLRLEVDDGLPERLPSPGASSRGDFRGRGLLMVDGISRSWGVARHARFKTVWVEIPFR